MQACWVGKWEYGRTIYVFGHLSNTIFRKCAWLGGGANENMRFDLLDDRQEVIVFFPFPLLVIPGIW